MALANTRAYYIMGTIVAVNCFIVQALVVITTVKKFRSTGPRQRLAVAGIVI
jgi:hypothetical protein